MCCYQSALFWRLANNTFSNFKLVVFIITNVTRDTFQKDGFFESCLFCQENTVREKVNFSSEKGEFVKIAEKNYLERVAYDC